MSIAFQFEISQAENIFMRPNMFLLHYMNKIS